MILDFTDATMVRKPGEVDLSDITSSQISGEPKWDGAILEIPFDVEPSAAEQSKIRRRLMTADTAEETQVDNLLSARAALVNDNSTYGRILRLLVNDRLRDIKEA